MLELILAILKLITAIIALILYIFHAYASSKTADKHKQIMYMLQAIMFYLVIISLK